MIGLSLLWYLNSKVPQKQPRMAWAMELSKVRDQDACCQNSVDPTIPMFGDPLRKNDLKGGHRGNYIGDYYGGY